MISPVAVPGAKGKKFFASVKNTACQTFFTKFFFFYFFVKHSRTNPIGDSLNTDW